MHSQDSRSTATPVARNNVRGLLALNAALLGLLSIVTLSPSVKAQIRGRGTYTMVAGRANGTESSAVYIVDAANQELMIIAYDRNTKLLDGIGYRNLAVDAAELLRGRSRPGN